MRATIQHIEKELTDIYPKREIRSITRLILEHVCGMDYTRQVLLNDAILGSADKEKIAELVKRLKNHEPVQYVLGETEFMELRLKVAPGVLIPRPETEELVEWVIQTGLPASPAVLDVGTGSGCIALALKHYFLGASVSAVDISDQALEIARNNARLNGLEVNFFIADILSWENQSWEKFDAIVSNPPYVRESEKKKMAANVLDFEPARALFVKDDDPLQFYRCISEFAARHLKEGGWLFYEINENLGNEMIALVKDSGFYSIGVRKDLSGKDRMLRCRR